MLNGFETMRNVARKNNRRRGHGECDAQNECMKSRVSEFVWHRKKKKTAEKKKNLMFVCRGLFSCDSLRTRKTQPRKSFAFVVDRVCDKFIRGDALVKCVPL